MSKPTLSKVKGGIVNKRTSSKLVCILFVFCAATAIAAPAQILTTLHSFAGYPNDAANPYAGLVQASDGNFYGTAPGGGANNRGTVFKITPSGALTTLYNFCSQTNCADGQQPYAGLIRATDGNFYGTTLYGGANDGGTVFKITPSGALTTLYSFCSQSNCSDGANPYGGLVQGTDGNFYGTTTFGGLANCSPYGCGTVFKITPSGALTTLYSFCSQSGCPDGNSPNAGLVEGTDGNLYGTTASGGTYGNYCPYGCGTVFKITPSGTLTTLHAFAGYPSEGAGLLAGLIQAADGSFYGTTQYGGGTNDGTVFKITLGGALTTLYNFCSLSECADGAGPQAGLVQGSDGNFYGTTPYGGNGPCSSECGTIFKVTPNGTLTTLHSFSGSDGAHPFAALVQASDGNFYGTTVIGGAKCYPNGCGTVFRLVTVRACTVCPSLE